MFIFREFLQIVDISQESCEILNVLLSLLCFFFMLLIYHDFKTIMWLHYV